MSHRHKEKINPLLIEATSPAALSIGRRCMEMGYGFYWPPHGKPKMVDPNGRNIPMEVHHYCPYILDHSRVPGSSTRSCAAPATKSSSSSEHPGEGFNPGEAQADEVVDVACPRTIMTVKPALTADGRKDSDPHESATHSTDSNPVREDAAAPQPAPDPADAPAHGSLLTDAELHALDHEHKRDDCPTCKRVRVQQLHHGRAAAPSRRNAVNFGDHVTADHFIAKSEFDRRIDGESAGLVITDVATDDLECL
jgi:hypothetical protein